MSDRSILPWRAWRETTGLTMTAVSDLTGIPLWRLSLVERGVPATDEEKQLLQRVLAEASGLLPAAKSA